MTRERVEQATYKLSVRLKVDDDEGLEALQFLSNALAESEKERERLREALEQIANHPDPYTGKAHAEAEFIAIQALSPDSQEKSDG